MPHPTPEQMIKFYKAVKEGVLTDEKLDFVLNNLEKIEQKLAIADSCKRVSESVKPTTKLAQIQKWCRPVSDEEARGIFAAKYPKDASDIANLRNFAKEVFDRKENIFYKIEAGFDFQEHAPEIGHCYNDWQNPRQWKLKNKEATSSSLVFWIPRLLPKSCSKTVGSQMKLMAYYRKKYNLPKNCLENFGSASLNTLLILERSRRIDERVPLNCYWIRTDTLRADVRRLRLGYFGKGGLSCVDWGWAHDEDANLGCFPSGVWNL